MLLDILTAQLRGYDTQQLLSYELTAFAFYLEKKDDKLHSKLKKRQQNQC